MDENPHPDLATPNFRAKDDRVGAQDARRAFEASVPRFTPDNAAARR